MWGVVVVGYGGVGSFALRAATQIAKTTATSSRSRSRSKALKILGIEQYKPCHEYGSSHGKSRIYRHAYFEHED